MNEKPLHPLIIHILIQSSFPKIMLGLLYQYTAEEEEGEEVRDGHERIHAVGQVPYDGQVHHGSNKDGDDIQDAVDILSLEL